METSITSLTRITFLECLFTCIRTESLVANFDRLQGTHLSQIGRRSPLEAEIDRVTGRDDAALQKFVEFVHEYVWLRLPPEIRKEVNEMNSDPQVGDGVLFVDPTGQYRAALVGAVHGTGSVNDEGKYSGPSLNLVVMDDNEGARDSYGRQVDRRNTSVVHRSNQAAHGMYWMTYEEARTELEP